MVRVAFVAVLLLAAAGCSVFLKPANEDLGLPTRFDGGDASADGSDGGVDDASDGDTMGHDMGPDACMPRPEDCNDMTGDRDCDGYAGCNDLDCQSSFACCAGGTSFIAEEWMGSVTSSWGRLPNAAGWPSALTMPTGILHFGTDGVSRGLRWAAECPSLGLGFETDVIFHVGSCPGSTSCTDHAAVLLTPAVGLPSASLPADLEVSVTATPPQLHVRAGGADLTGSPAALTLDATNEVEILVGVTPGVVAGIPVLLATVSSVSGVSTTPIVIDAPFARLADLLPAGTCGNAGPGLYYTVEGTGQTVGLQRNDASTLSCANPSQLAGALSQVTVTDLGWTDGFAAGGPGAPSLAAYATATATRNYELFADASHDARALESVAHVHFELARATQIHAPGWPPPMTTWTNPVTPAAALFDATRSIREPTVVALPGTPVSYLGFAAEETATPGIYEARLLLIGSLDVALGHAIALPAGECTSVRDPAIARDTGGRSPLWLFYTCEHGTMPSDIRAVQLDGSNEPSGPSTVVVTSAVGAWASAGVRGPEPLLRYTASPGPGEPAVRLRLFFTGTSPGGGVLGMAQGQGMDVMELPLLTPYAGNPIATGAEAALGGCTAPNHCEISGVAVAKDPAATSTLDMVLARRVDSPTAGTAWQLLLVTQTLETFW